MLQLHSYFPDPEPHEKNGVSLAPPERSKKASSKEDQG